MHVVHEAEFFSPAARGPGLVARAAAAFQAWRARETERRLLLDLNERLREDCGLGPAAPRSAVPQSIYTRGEIALAFVSRN